MQSNLTTGSNVMIDQQILVPILDQAAGESLLPLAVRLAAGSDRRSGLLVVTVVAGDDAPEACVLHEAENSSERVPGSVELDVPVMRARLAGRDAAECIASLAAEQPGANLLLLDWPGTPLFSGPPADVLSRLFLAPPLDMAALYTHNLDKIRRILVAEDVGGDAGLAVRLAYRLVRSGQDTEVTILRVVSPLPGVDYSLEQLAVEELVRSELGEVEANIKALVVQADSVADAVLEEASGYDLLIISAPDQAIWRSWLGGATSDDIVEHAPCSVLLVKEQQQEPSSLFGRVLTRLLGPGDG